MGSAGAVIRAKKFSHCAIIAKKKERKKKPLVIIVIVHQPITIVKKQKAKSKIKKTLGKNAHKGKKKGERASKGPDEDVGGKAALI